MALILNEQALEEVEGVGEEFIEMNDFVELVAHEDELDYQLPTTALSFSSGSSNDLNLGNMERLPDLNEIPRHEDNV